MSAGSDQLENVAHVSEEADIGGPRQEHDILSTFQGFWLDSQNLAFLMGPADIRTFRDVSLRLLKRFSNGWMRWKAEVLLLMIMEKKHLTYLSFIDLGARTSGDVWKCLEIDFQTFPDISRHIWCRESTPKNFYAGLGQ